LKKLSFTGFLILVDIQVKLKPKLAELLRKVHFSKAGRLGIRPLAFD
jgi:hypothetical protein